MLERRKYISYYCGSVIKRFDHHKINRTQPCIFAIIFNCTKSFHFGDSTTRFILLSSNKYLEFPISVPDCLSLTQIRICDYYVTILQFTNKFLKYKQLPVWLLSPLLFGFFFISCLICSPSCKFRTRLFTGDPSHCVLSSTHNIQLKIWSIKSVN